MLFHGYFEVRSVWVNFLNVLDSHSYVAHDDFVVGKRTFLKALFGFKKKRLFGL